VKNGLEQGIDRGLSYAPYSDLIWMETGNPDLGMAREFAQVSMPNILAKCWLTTVRHRLTGRSLWTRKNGNIP
jgi:hypothetical protein